MKIILILILSLFFCYSQSQIIEYAYNPNELDTGRATQCISVLNINDTCYVFGNTINQDEIQNSIETYLFLALDTGLNSLAENSKEIEQNSNYLLAANPFLDLKNNLSVIESKYEYNRLISFDISGNIIENVELYGKDNFDFTNIIVDRKNNKYYAIGSYFDENTKIIFGFPNQVLRLVVLDDKKLEIFKQEFRIDSAFQRPFSINLLENGNIEMLYYTSIKRADCKINGDFRISEIDPNNGSIISTKVFNKEIYIAPKTIKLSNGDRIIGGSLLDSIARCSYTSGLEIRDEYVVPYLCRLDKDMNIIWESSLGEIHVGSYMRYINAIIQTQDDNFIAVGTREYSEGPRDSIGASSAWVVKFDENGNEIWRKEFLFTVKDINNGNIINDIVELSDGSLIAVGNIDDGSLKPTKYPRQRGVIIKMDKDGEVITSSTGALVELNRKSPLIYPVPTENILHIDMAEYPQAIYSLLIYDIEGREMNKSEFQNKKIEINTASWMSGAYIISIFDKYGNEIINKKIVK